jgi:hypothetical protein
MKERQNPKKPRKSKIKEKKRAKIPTSLINEGDDTSDRSTTKKLSKSLKKKIELNNYKFKKSLRINQKSVDTKKLTSLFEKVSERSRRKILNYTLKSLSIINSVYYVNTNLKEALGAEDTSISVSEIDMYVKRLFRIKMISIILKEFNLDESLNTQILSALIERQFNPNKPIKESASNEKSLIEKLSKELENVSRNANESKKDTQTGRKESPIKREKAFTPPPSPFGYTG